MNDAMSCDGYSPAFSVIANMPANSQSHARKAALKLMDGNMIQGRLAFFSPDAPDIRFCDGSSATGGLSNIPVEQVAYVAFECGKNDSVAYPRPSGIKSVRIHTETEETFDTHVLDISLHASGFYAFMPQYEYVYFFHHGVRTLEDKRPLGEILVTEGLVSENDLKQGLEVQQKKRSDRIGHFLVEEAGLQRHDVAVALQQQKHKRKRLGEILLDAGLVRSVDIDRALAIQAEQRDKRLGEILVDAGAVSEKDLLLALAAKFHLSIADLDKHPPNLEALFEIDEFMIKKYRWLPIATDRETLTVAISDPLDIDASDAFHLYAGKHIRRVLVLPSQLRRHIEDMLDTSVESESEKLSIEINTRKGEAGKEPESNEIELMKNAGAPPVVQLVNKILMGGLRKGASDIHLLPQARHLTLAYRINGDLLTETHIKKEIQQYVISRIKIISGMDISDRRMPQDGRMVVSHKKRPVEFRVSSIPNIHGESIVMRILNKEVNMDIETLGLRHEDYIRLAQTIRKPHGLILATGPTGSGKSTTLFALVKSLVNSSAHIVTIEDPVEAEIPGVNQIQVKPKIGLDFAHILRNILRHDPDIIMLGEIRDHDTAEIAMRAALTGHLLLSTLHTNTAVDTVVRLVDMGIPSYLLAQGLLAIISQNLIKRLCQSCRTPVSVSKPVAALLNDLDLPVPEQLFCATGCKQCNQTGYTGRCVAYELLEINDRLGQAIHDGVIGQELQRIAIEEGMCPKKQHVLDLARDGTISSDDMMRFLP